MSNPIDPIPALSVSSGRTIRLLALGRLLMDALPGPGPGARSHIGTRAPKILLSLKSCLETQSELLLEPGPSLGGIYLGDLEEEFVPLQERLDLHGVHAIAFLRGASLIDIQTLFEGLVQEPAQLEGRGGLRGYMERSYAQRIQVRSLDSVPDLLPEHILGEVRETLSRALAPPDAFTGNTAGWLHLVADLSEFGQTGHRLGLGKGEPEDSQLAVIRRAFSDLSPDQVLSLARGLPSLPSRPIGLSIAFRRTVPECLSAALVQFVARGMPWLVLQDPMMEVVEGFPAPLTDLLPALHQGLAAIAREPLVAAFLAEADWRAMPLAEQLAQALLPGRYMSLPEESRAFLLERALKSHRLEAAVELVGGLDETLLKGDSAQKSSALRSIRVFLPHTATTLVPDYLADALGSILVGAFLRVSEGTPDPILRECLLEFFLAQLARRQPAQVMKGLQALEAGVAVGGSIWEKETLGWIRRGLEGKVALDSVLECLQFGDRAEAITSLQSYFELIGEPFYHHAAWALGQEANRGRRDRLIRALRAGGALAEPAVLQMLRPGMPWFHARNLLLVLSSVGSGRAVPNVLPFLNHDDPRVRIGALRALRQCGGRQAVPHLIAALSDPIPDLQQEAIHLLGQQKAPESVRPLCALALDSEAPLVSRLKTVETLGLLGSKEALNPLFELASRRGGFLRTVEPDALRLAAAKVIGRLPGGGRAILEKLIGKEGRGGLTPAFQGLLADLDGPMDISGRA